MTPICAAPIVRGPLKGQPATGTGAGYKRHWKAGEKACEACLEAMRVADAIRAAEARSNEPVRHRRRGYLIGNLPPVSVKCAGCGSRGRANPILVGRSRIVASCVECRGAA